MRCTECCPVTHNVEEFVVFYSDDAVAAAEVQLVSAALLNASRRRPGIGPAVGARHAHIIISAARGEIIRSPTRHVGDGAGMRSRPRDHSDTNGESTASAQYYCNTV